MSGEEKKLVETARQRFIEAAQQDIEQMNRFNLLTLSESDWNQFMKVMGSPIKINKNLKKDAITIQKTFE